MLLTPLVSLRATGWLLTTPSFLLYYINDISEGIHSQIKLFADDCLVHRNVQTSTDQQILQQDLNTLMKWADKWQMKFNIKKCKIVQISNHRNKIVHCIAIYNGWHSINDYRTTCTVILEYNYIISYHGNHILITIAVKQIELFAFFRGIFSTAPHISGN